MAVGSVNYPAPVQVNGFSCRNCSDVSLAQKNIDPAHPGSGANNKDAATDPSRTAADPVRVAAAKKASDAAQAHVVGYTAAGPQMAALAAGAAFSLAA
jgi:hypothetical protein